MLALNDFKNKLANNGTVKWKSDYDFEQFWCFDMQAEPDAIWTYIADTSRFNRELGFSPRHQQEIDGKAVVTTTMVGFEQIWIEEPWTWVSGQTVSAERIYKKGMAEKVHAVFHIERENNKSKVYIYFGWHAKHWFWSWFIQATESVIKGKFGKTFEKIDAYLAKNKNDFSGRALKAVIKPLNERQQSRLNELKTALKSKPVNPALIDKLVEYVTTADDLELESIRALKLVNEWNQSLKDVLGLCLHATRVGLLNISWNVVCPHCKGSRFSAGSLGDIPEDSNCDTCEIDFSTSEPDVVEIVFKVNKAVREIPEVLYCAAEPAKKSHIKIQQKIEPQKSLSFKVPHKAGYYRARAIGNENSVKFYVDKTAEDKKLEILTKKLNEEVVKLGLGSELTVKNQNSEDLVFSFEELQWSDNALKPSQVLSFSEFRDLFADEHLNSNVKLHLGEQTILFTDIVGSTKFYEAVGDAKAFADVRAHFQEMFQEIKKADGVVVKTIGDAVMASFPSAVDAFNAAVAIQKRFHENRNDLSIRVRISIHTGQVIAVQLNTGIDYFGSVVNLGAKIQSCAGAGEIAMLTNVYNGLKQKADIDYPVIERSHSRDIAEPVPVTVVRIS